MSGRIGNTIINTIMRIGKTKALTIECFEKAVHSTKLIESRVQWKRLENNEKNELKINQKWK